MGRLFDDASTHMAANTSLATSAFPFSMACWFYCDDASNVGTLMCVDNTGALSFCRMVLVGTASPKELRGNSQNATTGAQATVTAWVANTWHHACAVFNANNDRRIYLDGSKATNTTSISGGAALTQARIGARHDGTSLGQYFSGRIAEAALWHGVALGDGEVAALAGGMSPLRCHPEAIHYWPLHGVGSPEPDFGQGSTRYNLTLTGPPTVIDHARTAPAFGFDGEWMGAFTAAAAAATGQPAVKRMGGVRFAHSLGRGMW